MKQEEDVWILRLAALSGCSRKVSALIYECLYAVLHPPCTHNTIREAHRHNRSHRNPPRVSAPSKTFNKYHYVNVLSVLSVLNVLNVLNVLGDLGISQKPLRARSGRRDCANGMARSRSPARFL